MKHASKFAVATLGSLALALTVAAAFAHPAGMGPGMMRGMGPMGGPMAGHMQHDDPAFTADMQLVHELIMSHDQIKRTVTNLPNGIKTVTESDDPRVAQTIKAHVASMEKRLDEGK